MDLNSAMSIGNKYKDYHDAIASSNDLNRNVSNRIFDLSPMTMSRLPLNSMNPQPRDCVTPLCQVDNYAYNDYNKQSNVRNSSREFLEMKHAQELETMMENPTSNQMEVQRLKETQFNETRALADQVQMKHANKYKNLKYMSPDTLNQVYGRQKCQNILPDNQYNNDDVYKQTSCMGQSNQSISRDLKKEIDNRQQQILSQKSKGGIQSFRNYQIGTDINEAYS